MTTLRLECITYGNGTLFDPEKFQPIQNYFLKPQGGLWATPIGSGFGWKEWCEENNFHQKELKESFTFVYEGRTLVIDSEENIRSVPCITTGSIIPFPDYEHMLKQEVQGIHMTLSGLRATSSRFFPFPEQPWFYGWDCESLLVMDPSTVKAGSRGETGSRETLFPNSYMS